MNHFLVSCTHRFNHTLDLTISHEIDLTGIDIIPQSDHVTDHFLVSCTLHITDINYMAQRYRGSQMLCVPINTN